MDRCGPSSVLDSKRDVADSDTGYEVFDTPCDHGELQAVLTLDLHTAEKTRAKYQLRHNDVSTFNSNRERHSLALTTEAPGIIDRAAAVLSFPLTDRYLGIASSEAVALASVARFVDGGGGN